MQLYERGRSLGLGVQVSAQSWQGLGGGEDERYRIAATADGGIWLMHTPYPEPVCELAGTRRVIETAHKLIGGMWGDEGTSRVQHAWTADPADPHPGRRAGLLHPPRRGHLRAGRPAQTVPLPLPAARPPAPTVIIPPPGRQTRHPRRLRRRRLETRSGRRARDERPGPVRRAWACLPART